MTKVKGLNEWKRRWSAIPKRVRNAVAETMEEVAEDLVSEMRSLAPKDTGAGAGSINWTWGEAPKGSLVIGIVSPSPNERMIITIYAAGNDEFYMRFQEFGTKDMPAHPFFFPVWRARRRSAKSKITRSIGKAIRSR